MIDNNELLPLENKLDQILELLLKPANKLANSDNGKGLLYAALAKAQGTYKRLVPNEESAQGKYANLEAILAAVKDSLAKNSLAFVQNIELLDKGSGAALLKTIIGHESGQVIESYARVFAGKTDRESGNTIENHKRIHALMLLGIAPSENDPISFDDDGGEQEEDKLVQSIVKAERTISVDPNDVITKSQYNELLIALGNEEKIAISLMKLYKIDTLADLNKDVYHDALAKVRRIKKAEDDYSRRKK